MTEPSGLKRSARSVTALVAATLAGCAGLGLESVVLPLCGLAVGQSRASAWGLGVFVASWAIGAWLAGRARSSTRRAFFVLAIVAPSCAALAGWRLLALGATGAGGEFEIGQAFAWLALSALPQGFFLPWLARARGERGVAPLIACNLLGSLAGAWWLGFVAVGAWGRVVALALAAGCAVVAALLGAASTTTRSDAIRARTPLRAGWVVGCATLWMVGLEWLCLRLGVLWIGSEQAALATVLACSLVALALGAAVIPLLVPRDSRGVAIVLGFAALASIWPVFAAPALARASEHGDFATMLTLCVPTLAPLGALLPVLHRSLSGESGARLGGLLLHEAWGALAAGPLVHWVLVPRFGVGGAIGALTVAGAAACIALANERRALALGASAAALLLGAVAYRAPEPALASPKLVDPALTLRAFAEDREFAVAVVDDGLIGERTLLTDQFRAAGTGRDYRYMRALGHLPVLLHAAPKRVGVVALGTGTTLGAVSLHSAPERIDVLEISPAVVAMAPWFDAVNRNALADPRVRVLIGDARHTLALEPGGYDVLTMEPLLPDSPFGVYLYTREFYAVAKRALAPGGLLCQWVPPHALEADVFDAVVDAFASSFAWSNAWLFGTQLVLIGSDDAPEPSNDAPDSFGDPRSGAIEADLALDHHASSVEAYRIASLARWPRSARDLSDADPWIAYRRKPRGLTALAWLPENLERVLAAARADERFGGGANGDLAALLLARIAHARAEIDLRAGRIDSAQARDRAREPNRSALNPGSFGAGEFADEIEFLFQLRRGVSALHNGQPDHALDALVRAADLRPERGDVHVYLAAARQQLGLTEGARTSLAKALELCPRILETPAGIRARQLGLGD